MDNLGDSRLDHKATLLPSGLVLVTGGSFAFTYAYNTSKLFYAGLDFLDIWRPEISNPPTALFRGEAFKFTGSNLRGYGTAEVSSGGSNSSPANVPLVQVRRLDNQQIVWLPLDSFTRTSYTSLPVWTIPPGPALVTVFVNGIPSVSQFVNVVHPVKMYLPLLRR